MRKKSVAQVGQQDVLADEGLDGGSAAGELAAKLTPGVAVGQGDEGLGVDHVEHPAPYAHEEGGRGFIDLEYTFEGNAEVAQNEEDDDGCNHAIRN